MKIQKRVHVIPVGDDPLDRITIPAQDGKADFVHLLTMDGQDLFAGTVEAAVVSLQGLGIPSTVERTNLEDLHSLIKTLITIIRDEHAQGNSIFYSLSTGGNLAGAAGMFAALYFGITPYFYALDMKTNKLAGGSLVLPKLKVDPPAVPFIRFLGAMQQYMVDHTTISLSKKECLGLMQFLHPGETFSSTPGDYNKLKFRYLDKLLQLDYISVETQPRGKITLTPDGLFALEAFSIYYNLDGSSRG